MTSCKQCGKELEYKEIGAYKKFVNRGATQYLCLSCLSEKLDVPMDLLEAKIIQFKEQGCLLFI